MALAHVAANADVPVGPLNIGLLPLHHLFSMHTVTQATILVFPLNTLHSFAVAKGI